MSNSVCHFSLLKIYLNFSLRTELRTEHLKCYFCGRRVGRRQDPDLSLSGYCILQRDKQSDQKLRQLGLEENALARCHSPRTCLSWAPRVRQTRCSLLTWPHTHFSEALPKSGSAQETTSSMVLQKAVVWWSLYTLMVEAIECCTRTELCLDPLPHCS